MQYISDIHLEFVKDRNRKLIVQEIVDSATSNVKYLAICGDLSTNPESSVTFMKELYNSGKYKDIFYISGNHEYYQNRYGRNIAWVDFKIRELCKNLEHIHFLQRDYIEMEEFIVVGCTLWTYPDDDMVNKMNDYKKIQLNSDNSRKRINVNTIREIYKQNIDYLEKTLNMLNMNKTKTIIVLTHHGPSLTLGRIGEYTNSAYYSNCEHLLSLADYWIYGHDHESKMACINNCIIVSNPRGYPREETGYTKGKYIL